MPCGSPAAVAFLRLSLFRAFPRQEPRKAPWMGSCVSRKRERRRKAESTRPAQKKQVQRDSYAEVTMRAIAIKPSKPNAICPSFDAIKPATRRAPPK